MNQPTDPCNPDLTPQSKIAGFEIQRVRFIEDIAAWYYELFHSAAGARYIHISRADDENTFSVGFKTVPADSTGVAHILEHTVLCGSRHYPVRDPFFSMLKRSLSTFMNAFTSSDWTLYPFATQNQKDFYNLMSVYLDAVFYPNLDDLSFKQEGHRLDIERGDPTTGTPELTYKGVVYNEMKGALSSPDQVLAASILKALYPDTAYRHNSGGDPEIIPKLTHRQLIDFHRRHYHPSNAYFYSYGNLPLRRHLKFINDKVLARFERIDPRTVVPPQPRWSTPRRASASYRFTEDRSPERKSQVCISWLTADIRDGFEILVLALLEQILVGNAASPLRKALMDSGLGTAPSDVFGFDADNRDTLFACGLKDVAAEDADKIETLVLDTLSGLADSGVESELVEAALHQLEFYKKEITNTPYPFGLKLVLSFLGSWLHGGDPYNVLQLDEHLKHLRRELEAGPFFEERIRTHFLENPHRLVLTLNPDPQLEAVETRRMTAELQRLRDGLSSEQLQQIVRDADALMQLQESREDLSVLPTLELSDIAPDVTKVESSPEYAFPAADCYEAQTRGIVYFSAALGCGHLSETLLPLVPFFSYALPKIGTKRRNYLEMARRMDTYTGGVGLAASARTAFGPRAGECLPYVSLNSKCLLRNQSRMADLLYELMAEYAFSDLTRLKTLLLEYRANLETMVIHNGHRLAMSLAGRNFSSAAALGEVWHGIHQLTAIKNRTDSLTEAQLASIAVDLKAIAADLFNRKNLKLALIGEPAGLREWDEPLARIREGIGQADIQGFQSPPLSPQTRLPREGWSTASAVSFVAQALETVPMAHEDGPALAVISKLLRSSYLHREIREKGGAYGGFALYSAESGLFHFASYRDPHIAATLGVYEAACDFIRSEAYTRTDIKEAILQVCSEIDKPDPPGPEARKAFFRKLISLTDEERRRFKERLLSLEPQQVRRAADRYFQPGMRRKAVAVISGREQLQDANRKLASNPLEIHAI